MLSSNPVKSALTQVIREKFAALGALLNERTRRRWAAVEARVGDPFRVGRQQLPDGPAGNGATDGEYFAQAGQVPRRLELQSCAEMTSHTKQFILARRLSQSKSPNPPIFLVTEEYETIPATQFANGECFLIDEWRNGKALIEGGREGKRALLAFKTSNGAWPDFSSDSHAVNTVLAAVKVEQNVTHHLDELYSCSCFVSDGGRAVYTAKLTMSVRYGGVRVSSPVDTDGLRGKVAGVRSIYDGLRQDSLKTPQVAELIDAILLDKTRDDAHFRLWYLRLWQAVVDAKRILGQPKFEDEANTIAGNLTAIQLKEYRDRIAHWWTGNVDFSFVTGIQQTVQELMRRKYRKEMSE